MVKAEWLPHVDARPRLWARFQVWTQVQAGDHGICPLLFIVIVEVLAQPAVFRNHEAWPDGRPVLLTYLGSPVSLFSIWSLVNSANAAAPEASCYLPLQAASSPWSVYLYITSCCGALLVLLLFLSICKDVNCGGIYSSLEKYRLDRSPFCSLPYLFLFEQMRRVDFMEFSQGHNAIYTLLFI